ncbi:hypothetical protein BH09BAC1_BH09BAC1_23130 [soil metagenome]
MKLFLLLALSVLVFQTVNKVPDEKTAIKIAEVEWLKIYGDRIYDKTPFCAELENDSIWHVYGTLSPITLGGVPEAYINKRTAEVIKITHGR